jgi:general secretion pathway protein L
MSTLLLHLPLATPGPHTPYSYTLTADGHAVTGQGSAPPATLPPTGRTGETVALVPIRALSWHRVTLPQGLSLSNGARLRAVLEGLLEERLLDDPAQLHFALQPDARAGEAAWIAVCDRAWLQACLQVLEAAQRPVGRIVPEFAPGTTPPAEYFALGTPEDAQFLATAQGESHSLGLVPLAVAPMLLAQAPAVEGDAPPQVWADPAVAALTEKRLGRPVALSTVSERALRAARGPWDLAQFTLAGQGRQRLLRKLRSGLASFLRAPQWRAARWAAALTVVAHLMGLNAWAWQEQRTLAAKQAAVRSTLTQTFPQVKVIVDAPLQMERELAQLRLASGDLSTRDLEPMMAAVGRALPPGAQITGLEFQNAELRLRGLKLSPEALDSLRTQLGAGGYQAQEADDSLRIRAEATP